MLKTLQFSPSVRIGVCYNVGSMSEPVIVARSDHPISRSSIDPDALKVLTRLHEFNYTAYLVGGSVRDLLLRPPAEGLRRRHLRASVSDQEAVPELLDHRPALPPRARELRRQGHRSGDVPPARPGGDGRTLADDGDAGPEAEDRASENRDLQIHRDNTFGTPEEDAFRRDFTVNALFYDIADRSIIDYVGGLDDLRDARHPLDRRSQ